MNVSRRTFTTSAAAAAACFSAVARGQDIILGADPAPAAAESGAIPFKLEGGHILLNARIDAAANAAFYLDTGAALTSLDGAFASANHITTAGGLRATGLRGARVDAGFAHDLDVSFAGLSLHDRSAMVLDLPNELTDRGLDARLAGLLGCNVLNESGIAFDFRTGTLTWLNEPPTAAPGDVVIPLKARIAPSPDGGTGVFMTQFTIPLTFGGVTGDFILDTGAAGSVHLSREFADRIGLFERPGRQISLLSPGGIDGYTRVILVISPNFAAADFPMAPRVISVARDAPPRAEQTDFSSRHHHLSAVQQAQPIKPAGLVGLLALRPIRAVIDCRGQQLIITPTAPLPAPPRMLSFGLSLAKPTHAAFEVLSVIDGTPAQSQGIRPGARIASIGGQPATSLSLWRGAGLINQPGKGTEIAFDDGHRMLAQPVQILP